MGGGKEEGENGEPGREMGRGRGGGSQWQIHAQFHFAQLPTLYYNYLSFFLSFISSPSPPIFSSSTSSPPYTHYISLQWTVASSALKILLKLVDQHELSSEDLIEQNYEILQGAAGGGGVVGGVGGGHATQFIKLPKPPGFNILLHLLNDTPLLRKVRMHIDCT